MKPVLGLKLSYLPIQKKGEESKLIVVGVKVSKGVVSKNFLTSPIIRESLLNSNFREGSEFGGMIVEYTPSKKKLRFTSYHPIPVDKGIPEAAFTGKGIAARIESRVEESARKAFPEFETVTHYNPTKFRQDQLKKRGFNIWDVHGGIKRKDFTRTLREKVAKDLRAKRKLK